MAVVHKFDCTFDLLKKGTFDLLKFDPPIIYPLLNPIVSSLILEIYIEIQNLVDIICIYFYSRIVIKIIKVRMLQSLLIEKSLADLDDESADFLPTRVEVVSFMVGSLKRWTGKLLDIFKVEIESKYQLSIIDNKLDIFKVEI